MRRTRAFICVIAAFALAGCAGRTQLESDLGIKGAPDWVNKGTAYVKDRDGRLFHGVGSAGPMGDPALQRATADERARAELARIFSSYLDVVSRDYQAASRAGGEVANEEAVSRQIKNVSQVNLAGARIVARWLDKRTNTVYSIAELDTTQVKATVATARDMNEDVREFVRTNADNIFDRIAGEAR
ncbi:MAG TPA: hypothetical protein VF203_00295 [Burkholderiales bacterium]